MQESERIGIIVMLIICSIALLLSYFISSYFYIISIHLVLFFIYVCLESFVPSFWKFHKFLFQKTYQDLINENGINETYYKGERKKILKERFYTKNGKRHGKYESFILDGSTVSITANYDEGRLHGECRKFMSINPFGGGCYSNIEIYEHGELRNKKVYFTGASKTLDPVKKIRTLANETNFDTGNSEQGLIEEYIAARKDV